MIARFVKRVRGSKIARHRGTAPSNATLAEAEEPSEEAPALTTPADSEEPSRTPAPPASGSDALSRAIQVLTVAGLVGGGLVTAVVFFASARFYAELGAQPGDVGIGVQDVLARSLVGFTYLSFIAIAGATPAAVVIGAFVRLLRGGSSRRSVDVTAGVVALALLGLSGLALQEDAPSSWALAAGALSVLVVIGLWAGVPARLGLSGWDENFGLVAAAASVLFFFMLLVLAYFLMFRASSESAAAVRRGEAVVVRPFLPWGADVAEVEWVSGSGDDLSCGLYLGVAEGVVLVYVPRTPADLGTVERYPAAVVRVLSYPQQTSCRTLRQDPRTASP